MNNKDLKSAAKETKKKVQLRQVVSGLEALKTLSGQSIPVFESFKISLFLKNVSPFVESYELERNKLVKELGTPVLDDKKKETGNFNFTDEKAKEFNDKMNEILDVDVTVDIPEISVSSLGDVKIKPLDMTALLWLLKA